MSYTHRYGGGCGGGGGGCGGGDCDGGVYGSGCNCWVASVVSVGVDAVPSNSPTPLSYVLCHVTLIVLCYTYCAMLHLLCYVTLIVLCYTYSL